MRSGEKRRRRGEELEEEVWKMCARDMRVHTCLR